MVQQEVEAVQIASEAVSRAATKIVVAVEVVACGITMAFVLPDLRGAVACPFFLPDRRLSADWPFPQRLPLGAGWSGTCTAPGHTGVRPTDDELKTGCNMGYARKCSRLPMERHADAVRFCQGEERNGLQSIRYICERDFLPAGDGELLYETAAGVWRQPHPDARIQRMAECYLEAQRERRTPKTLENGDIVPAEALLSSAAAK